MDRDEGMAVLKNGGWLSAAPVEFQQAILSRGCGGGLIEQGYRVIVVRAPVTLRAFVDEG